MVLVRPESIAHGGAVDSETTNIKVKVPKRILHFCDGTLEEYSTDEEDVAVKHEEIVDPASMQWGPWFWYKAWSTGNTTLSVMDTVGEFFASLFGITTSRYYFELEEYKKNQAEAAKSKEEQQGWNLPSAVPIQEMNRISTISQPINQQI